MNAKIKIGDLLMYNSDPQDLGIVIKIVNKSIWCFWTKFNKFFWILEGKPRASKVN